MTEPIYGKILTEFAAFATHRAWTMELGHLRAYVRLAKGLQLERGELRIVAEEQRAMAARPADGRRPASSGSPIAVIPLLGAMSQRGGLSSAGTDDFSAAVKAAANDVSVSGIVLEVDSPGGEVYGIEEAYQEVRRARGQKPVVAQVNSRAFSGGYYVASGADEILVTPGGEVGSIGAYMAHEDWSRAMDEAGVTVTLVSAGEGKTDGNPARPLSEDALADMTATVERYYGMFVSAVSKGRKVPASTVRDKWKARIYGAEQAVEMGMADSIGTLQDAIGKADKLARARQRTAAALDVETEARMRARSR